MSVCRESLARYRITVVFWLSCGVCLVQRSSFDWSDPFRSQLGCLPGLFQPCCDQKASESARGEAHGWRLSGTLGRLWRDLQAVLDPARHELSFLHVNFPHLWQEGWTIWKSWVVEEHLVALWRPGSCQSPPVWGSWARCGKSRPVPSWGLLRPPAWCTKIQWDEQKH